MNENASSSTKIALNYGVIIGIVLIFYSLLLWALGFKNDNWPQYFSFVFMIIGLVMAVKQYRETNNGFLTYKQAFVNGFLTLLFAGILASLYSFIFFQFIAPGEIQVMIEKAEEQMVESNSSLSDEQIAAAMNYTKMFMTPVAIGIIGLITNAIFSLIIAAIAAAFLKKEEQQFV